MTTSVDELLIAARKSLNGIQRSVFGLPQFVDILFHTACVFEKNYRLQDIQLSKNPDFIVRSLNQNRGGEYRARTGDLLVANQALSQLS